MPDEIEVRGHIDTNGVLHLDRADLLRVPFNLDGSNAAPILVKIEEAGTWRGPVRIYTSAEDDR